MITEQQFTEALEKVTSKKMGKDFGFIAGVSYPYPVIGMASAGNFDGFIVWKIEEDISYQKRLKTETIEKNFQNIIEFLNEKPARENGQ